jgi:hypothetical protein
LTEKHRHELVPTGKPFSALFGAEGFGGGGELVAVDQG